MGKVCEKFQKAMKMKKKTAIFLTALLLLCMVIPAFAEQAVTFPQGNITSEPIELALRFGIM